MTVLYVMTALATHNCVRGLALVGRHGKYAPSGGNFTLSDSGRIASTSKVVITVKWIYGKYLLYCFNG